MGCSNDQFLLIVGDLFSLTVEIEGVNPEIISSVWFSSDKLDFSKELSFEDGNWILYISSEETKNFPIGLTLFDITAEFIDGNFQTAIYNGIIIIKSKTNEVVKNE